MAEMKSEYARTKDHQNYSGRYTAAPSLRRALLLHGLGFQTLPVNGETLRHGNDALGRAGKHSVVGFEFGRRR